MPIISRFYGITIRMYFQQAEHNPPHIHAIYGDNAAAITIRSREVIDGKLPPKALAMVREWITNNETALIEMWETQQFQRLSPLE